MHHRNMVNILLIDDDLLERELVDSVLQKHLSEEAFMLQHAFKCSEAITYLLRDRFDLVLLDNMLAASISGKFSVPVIRQYLKEAPLVIVSNNIDIDYLKDPEILGVSNIVPKSSLNAFLADFIFTAHIVEDAPTLPLNIKEREEKLVAVYAPKPLKEAGLKI